MEDQDQIPVVFEDEALSYAYDKGFEEFDGVLSKGELPPEEKWDIGEFTEGAHYINVVAPDLRAASGYADSGHGTYQVARDVAVVPPEKEDDRPIEAEKVASQRVFEAVFDAFHNGAYDALYGERGELKHEARI